ncbi:MAG: hypothetical protein MJ237_05080 [bacterium]|nr:hypothetical protein [bacterium]
MSNVNGDFWSKYDVGGNDSVAGDNKLTGEEVKKASADGWSVWDGFNNKDTIIKRETFRQYQARERELFEQKAQELGLPISDVYPIGTQLFDERYKQAKKQATEQAQKEFGIEGFCPVSFIRHFFVELSTRIKDSISKFDKKDCEAGGLTPAPNNPTEPVGGKDNEAGGLTPAPNNPTELVGGKDNEAGGLTPAPENVKKPKNDASCIVELGKYGTFNLNEIKAGIRIDDIKSEEMKRIFKKYDNGNGILEENELSKLKNDILDVAREDKNDNKLSSKEARHLLSDLKGINLKCLVDFLNELKQLSADIEYCISDENGISTVVKDENGTEIKQCYDKNGKFLRTEQQGTYNNNGKTEHGILISNVDGSISFKTKISVSDIFKPITISVEYQFKNAEDFKNSKPSRIIRNNSQIEEITYQSNGNRATSQTRINGVLSSEKIYNQNGLVKEEKDYNDGKLSSRIVTEYNGKTKTRETTYYDDGKKNEKTYNENGSVKEEKDYNENNKLTTYIKYENGKIKNKDLYNNGTIMIHAEFDENGQTIYEEHYNEQGILECRIWYENGTETKRTVHSQTDNKYHKGDVYNTTFTYNLITIENCNKNITKQINLNTLLGRFNANVRQTIFNVLKRMPGEVLMDLAIEIDCFLPDDNLSRVGCYIPLFDQIFLTIENGVDPETILHELGHAVSYTKDDYCPEEDSTYTRIVDSEMKNYLKDGNKKYGDGKDGRTSSDGSVYATASYNEMFAECYTLLMQGSCQSGDIIEKYFPRTLAYVNDKVNQIRNLKETVRH